MFCGVVVDFETDLLILYYKIDNTAGFEKAVHISYGEDTVVFYDIDDLSELLLLGAADKQQVAFFYSFDLVAGFYRFF